MMYIEQPYGPYLQLNMLSVPPKAEPRLNAIARCVSNLVVLGVTEARVAHNFSSADDLAQRKETVALQAQRTKLERSLLVVGTKRPEVLDNHSSVV